MNFGSKISGDRYLDVVLTFPLIRTKLIINEQIIKQVNHFKGLGNDIGYDNNYDVDTKPGKFQPIYTSISRISSNEVHREKN